MKDQKIIGCCALVPGKISLKFCTEEDITIEFLYVDPVYRGKRYSIDILRLVLDNTDIKYKYAYAWIKEQNIPSWRAFEHMGFEQIGNIMVSRWLRRIEILPEGKTGSRLYRKRNSRR